VRGLGFLVKTKIVLLDSQLLAIARKAGERLAQSHKPVGHPAGHATSRGQRTQLLRHTPIDSLAQAYKTPLAVILAASAGLSEIGELSAPQADLVALIGEQASLLAEITSQLLAAARMDANDVAIELKPVGVEPMIDEVIARLKDRLASLSTSIDLPDDSLVLYCDRQLMLLLLTECVAHACTYSYPGTTISIRAGRVDSNVVISVHSFRSLFPRWIWRASSNPTFHSQLTAITRSALDLAFRLPSESQRFTAAQSGSKATNWKGRHCLRLFHPRQTKQTSDE
jgi:signal transduction histidine kinase